MITRLSCYVRHPVEARSELHSQDLAAQVDINTEHIVAVLPSRDYHNPEAIAVKVLLTTGLELIVWVGDLEPGQTLLDHVKEGGSGPLDLFWFCVEAGEVTR